MNKGVIKQTAVKYWSRQYKQFLVESPLLDGVLGVGDTEAEAWKIFCDLLDDAYVAFVEKRMSAQYIKPGRPAKGKMIFSAEVKPKTRDRIKALAGDLNCSQGELIDLMLFFYEARKLDPPFCPAKAMPKISATKQTKKNPLVAWESSFTEELERLRTLAQAAPKVFEQALAGSYIPSTKLSAKTKVK